MAGGAFARDKMNIRANTPSPLLPQSSVQKGGVGGGGVFSGASCMVNSLVVSDNGVASCARNNRGPIDDLRTLLQKLKIKFS